MVLGMSLPVFTYVHVALSLIAILAGIVVLLGMIRSMRLNLITALFLITTVLTSVTGFFFPYHGVTPGIILGVLSLVVLLIAILARHSFHMLGKWRWIYIVSSVIALWFNVFVLIAQLFQKVPALHAHAPTGSEPPFLVSQVTVMLLFIILGTYAVRGFHPAPQPQPKLSP
jgi:hypothetical protein